MAKAQVTEEKEQQRTLQLPIEISSKGIEYVTVSKKEWMLIEESTNNWKFQKI